MEKFSNVHSEINKKIETDFEKYIKSEFFLEKHGRRNLTLDKEILKDTYMVGAKRGLAIIRDVARKYLKDPRVMLQILKTRGGVDE